MNWEALRDEVLELLKESAKDLASDVKGDLEKYLQSLTTWAVLAIQSGNQKLLASVEGQAKLLAQLEKIRAERVFFTTLSQVLTIAGRTAIALLAKAEAIQ